MNENLYNSYNDEMEINLLDLMFYLLKQWKTLILAVLIGALIGGGIYMVKKPAAEPSIEAVKSYEADPLVLESMDIAYQYRQLYQSQLNYNENSILMKLDPNEVYVGELKYYISAGDDTEYVSLLYQDMIDSEDILSELKSAGDLDCDESYVKEIVSCSVNRGSDSYVNGLLEEVLGNSGYIAKAAVIDYKIVFMDRDSCEAMLQVLSDEVGKLDQACQEELRTYELQEIYNSVSRSVDSSIVKTKESNISALNSYLTTYKNLESAFSEEDLAYYQVEYLDQEDEEDEAEEIVLPETSENPVKWLVIGIFLMCVVWGGYYLVKYLMDKHVKTSEELQDCYGLQLLGRLEMDRVEKKGLTGWLERAERKSRGNVDTIDYVATAIQSLNAKQVMLCVEQENAKLQEAASLLLQQCPGVQVGNMVHTDSEALESAKTMDGIILLVGIGYTNQRELRRSLDVCRLQKIPMLGVVAVEK